MDEVDTLVEKTAIDGYKQQLTDEENVPRSLPFFAAALAVLVAIAAAAKSAIPTPSLLLYPLTIWGLLVLLAVALICVFAFLLTAVRKRRFSYVMDEVAIGKYVADLREHYKTNFPSFTPDEHATVMSTANRCRRRCKRS